MKKIRMNVGAIALDRRNGDPIIFLSDSDKKRTLPIWVGMADAKAISLALTKSKSPRPMVHRLLTSTIESCGFSVQEVFIDDTEDDVFVAEIRLSKKADDTDVLEKAELVTMDARPADAIAVAVLTGAPIFVSQAVLDQSSMVLFSEDDHDDSEFKKFISEVKASDFKLAGPDHDPPSEA